MPYKDPEQRRQSNLRSYYKNKANGKHRAATRAHWKRRYELMAEAKSVPCADCGGVFPSECMDFDHVRGEKRWNIAQAIHRSLKAIEAEIAKCDVVCANCHRIRTTKRNRDANIVVVPLVIDQNGEACLALEP